MSRHYQLAGTATVGPKGQVVIPVQLREKMAIVPGDQLVVLYIEDKKSVAFISEAQIQTFIDQMGQHIDSLKDVVSREDG